MFVMCSFPGGSFQTGQNDWHQSPLSLQPKRTKDWLSSASFVSLGKIQGKKKLKYLLGMCLYARGGLHGRVGSLHPVGTQDGVQVVRLGSRDLYPLSHPDLYPC